MNDSATPREKLPSGANDRFAMNSLAQLDEKIREAKPSYSPNEERLFIR